MSGYKKWHSLYSKMKRAIVLGLSIKIFCTLIWENEAGGCLVEGIF